MKIGIRQKYTQSAKTRPQATISGFIDRVRRLDGRKAGTRKCRPHPTGPDFL
jgi:hypothetical protein